jgi:isopentenyldiphosphate isomerase
MTHLAEPYGELIVCFDENGKEIEPHTRAEVHTAPLKYWHGVTGITVVNRQGKILCSKRSEQLSQSPGKWQANFGGHVNFGQTFETNAVRELFAESGIKKEEKNIFFLEEYKNAEHKHIGKQFVCLFEGNISNLHFFDGEITEVKWMDMKIPWQEKLKNPEKWASVCSPERQEKIKEWFKNYV